MSDLAVPRIVREAVVATLEFLNDFGPDGDPAHVVARCKRQRDKTRFEGHIMPPLDVEYVRYADSVRSPGARQRRASYEMRIAIPRALVRGGGEPGDHAGRCPTQSLWGVYGFLVVTRPRSNAGCVVALAVIGDHRSFRERQREVEWAQLSRRWHWLRPGPHGSPEDLLTGTGLPWLGIEPPEDGPTLMPLPLHVVFVRGPHSSVVAVDELRLLFGYLFAGDELLKDSEVKRLRKMLMIALMLRESTGTVSNETIEAIAEELPRYLTRLDYTQPGSLYRYVDQCLVQRQGR